MANAYVQGLMDGTIRVHLRSHRITASWGKNPHSVRLAKTAFEVYYLAMQHLVRICDDDDAHTTLWKAIRAARTEGDGWGVDDLEEGFEHHAECLAELSKVDWSDGATENYFVKKSHGMFDRNVKGPECCVNFLDKMESQAKSGASSFVKMSSAMQDAKNASDGGDWGAFGAASTEIQKLEKKVKPWMFMMPDSVKSSAGSVFKYTDTFHKIHSAATVYAKLRYERNWDNVDAAALLILQEAASKLPVLGDFYSGALGVFINLDADLFWKKHHDRIQDRIAREGGGRF